MMTKALYYLTIPLQVPLVAALGAVFAAGYWLQQARQARYAADRRRAANLAARGRHAEARALAESWRRRRGWPLVLFPEEA
jgi:hypothetical protein